MTSSGTNFTVALSKASGFVASVFSAASISTVEAGQTITGLTFTVGGLVDGVNEKISVDGTAITLGAGSTGTTTSGFTYNVTIASGTATVVLTNAAGISTNLAQILVNGITYQNTLLDTPTAGNRTFTLTQIKDSGGGTSPNVDTTTLSLASTVNVTTVNDAPTLTATLANPTFTEGAGSSQATAVSVFSAASISTVEAGQTITGLTFTVGGLVDGVNEKISVDGTTITLGAGSTGTTTTNSMGFNATHFHFEFGERIIGFCFWQQWCHFVQLYRNYIHLPRHPRSIKFLAEYYRLLNVSTHQWIHRWCSLIVSGTTVTYTDPGTSAAIQDSTGNHATTTTVTPTTDVVAPTLTSSPLFYNGNWGLNKFVLNFNEELAAASNLGGFSVNGFSASIVDPLIPDRTTTSAGVAAYQSGSASGSGTCILPVSEKAFSISFYFNSLSTSASLQVKYVDPVPSNTNSLKDLAGNHATNMVLGAWTNDNLSAVDASFTSGKSVLVVGGMGNDTMTGGLANDTFVWFAGDAGTTTGAVDIVKSFGSNSSSDKLDISKLLTNSYVSGTSILSQWVTSVTTAQTSPGGVAGSTKIVIDTDGPGLTGAIQTIWLEGVNLSSTDPAVLKASGVLIA